MTGIVVASANGSVGIADAVEVLRQGGSVVEAVIAGIRPVESNPDDHSVGYSGLPNLEGVVELDASIMDGRGLRAGSVGALQDFRHAIDAAAAVMDTLPHVLIVGEGARKLATEIGLTHEDLLTSDAKDVWLSRFNAGGTGGEQLPYYQRVRELVAEMTSDPELVEEPPHGTVNFIARDRFGNIAGAVSTSGWAWKYPGRVGDSPIIGAGNYADNRFGAATCTGRGEMAQRACTAHSIVTFMRFGKTVEESVRMALEDLRHLDDPFASEMNTIAIDALGNHCAGSTSVDRTYISMSEEMRDFVEHPKFVVPLT